MDGDRAFTLGPDAQLERSPGRECPDLVGIEPMPVRTLAGGQQVEDRASVRPLASRAAACQVSAYQPPSGWARIPSASMTADADDVTVDLLAE